MKRGTIFSALLHIFIIVLMVVGIPTLIFDSDEDEPVIIENIQKVRTTAVPTPEPSNSTDDLELEPDQAKTLLVSEEDFLDPQTQPEKTTDTAQDDESRPTTDSTDYGIDDPTTPLDPEKFEHFPNFSFPESGGDPAAAAGAGSETVEIVGAEDQVELSDIFEEEGVVESTVPDELDEAPSEALDSTEPDNASSEPVLADESEELSPAEKSDLVESEPEKSEIPDEPLPPEARDAEEEVIFVDLADLTEIETAPDAEIEPKPTPENEDQVELSDIIEEEGVVESTAPDELDEAPSEALDSTEPDNASSEPVLADESEELSPAEKSDLAESEPEKSEIPDEPLPPEARGAEEEVIFVDLADLTEIETAPDAEIEPKPTPENEDRVELSDIIEAPVIIKSTSEDETVATPPLDQVDDPGTPLAPEEIEPFPDLSLAESGGDPAAAASAGIETGEIDGALGTLDLGATAPPDATLEETIDNVDELLAALIPPALPENLDELGEQIDQVLGDALPLFDLPQIESEELIETYRQSAASGFVENQYILGETYYRGSVVPRDLDQAAGWHGQAAEKKIHRCPVSTAEQKATAVAE